MIQALFVKCGLHGSVTHNSVLVVTNAQPDF